MTTDTASDTPESGTDSGIDIEAPDSQDGDTNTCERCGDEYDRYLVFVKDNFADLSAYVSCEYDNLCKPCRMAVTDYGVFLSESEREELEPKTEYMIDGESNES